MKLAAAVVGHEAGPVEHVLDARWVMAYSAGVGETDLPYYDTLSKGGPAVHPLFPVCYEWPVSQPLRNLPELRPLASRLIHAQHDLVLHRALRAGETVRTFARIVRVEQRSPGAFVVYRFEATSPEGERLTTSDFGALYRGVQVDGDSRTVGEAPQDPPAHSGALPQVADIAVAATAGHVYTECARIWNPIHTDVAYAKAAGLPGIILHGTATLAYSISSALRTFKIDARAVRRVSCRFTGMVPMPSTLALHAARDRNVLRFETRNDRGEAVLTRGQLLLQ